MFCGLFLMLLWLMDLLIKMYFLLKNNESSDLIEIGSREVSPLTATYTNWKKEINWA